MTKCVAEGKAALVKNMHGEAGLKFLKCAKPNKELLEKNDPFLMCTQFE